MRRTWLLALLIVAVTAILAWAWVDAGREPLREITVPVPVPDSVN